MMARILLADDDAATRDLVRRALATDGHTVSSTQDGTEALDKLREAPGGFDLLITDVQMPGLDGIALAETALAGSPQLRIVLMSGGKPFPPTGQADHLIRKPFTAEIIRQVVAKYA